MNRENLQARTCLWIIFADAISQRTCKRISSEEKSLRWVYLGKDFLQRKRTAYILGERSELIPVARDLRKIAEDIKREYVQWQDIISAQYKEDFQWWFTVTSSRNIHQSNIYRYICFLEVLKQLCISQEPPELVVVESPALAESIRSWAMGQGMDVKIVGFWSMRKYCILKMFHTVLRWGKFWVIQALRCLAALVSRIKASNVDKQVNEDFLIATMIHDFSLSDAGVLKDRHFPFLHEFVQKQGRKVAIYPFLYGFEYNFFSIYERMRASKTYFFIPEDTLDFFDYWDVFLYPLRVLCRKQYPRNWKQFDISPILREEWLEQDTVLGLDPLLTHHVCSKLYKKQPLLKNAVIWHENRASDKAVIMGLRKSFPNMMIVGSQAFLHHPYYLSLSPSPMEAASGVLPDIILTVSDRERRIAQIFSDQISAQPAAALRYQHLFEEKVQTAEFYKHENDFKILVILPYSITEAAEILDMIKDALPQLKGELHFYIKAHPTYTIDKARNFFCFEYWEKYFKGVKGSLSDVLDQADLVISSASSAMVEAAIKGIPVIFVGGQTSFEENLISIENTKVTTNCFSSEELAKAILFYTTASAEERLVYQEEGRKLRDLYFLPVNETTLRPYLG